VDWKQIRNGIRAVFWLCPLLLLFFDESFRSREAKE
jgi:hypothetical protein